MRVLNFYYKVLGVKFVLIDFPYDCWKSLPAYYLNAEVKNIVNRLIRFFVINNLFYSTLY